ncbi:S1 domain-containing RNA-binding protein [Nicoliella spurrieriana]|uniref:S1 domain-containing RNA-binding protein n=1 Tax=Nicoliella spurrieriana TaxID=2925830 RepID=A0A976X5L5_9LACO|nr:S1 domain-containing RNA-binding protein [Nicoliella spurrieriana]UQS87045.1 S1 domain-containing RNA-binding protein [Nicoliella spurrieriana]
MAIEVGAKIPGKVSGITNFGAFVDLGDHKTGLVHISEVSDGFVKDIHDVLKVGDQVNVKVLKIGDDGKIALSMKQANDEHSHNNEHHGNGHFNNHNDHHSRGDHNDRQNFHGRGGNNHFNNHHGESNNDHQNNKTDDFDDMMSKFLKQSDSRLATIKKNTEGKRGGRGGRWS